MERLTMRLNLVQVRDSFIKNLILNRREPHVHAS